MMSDPNVFTLSDGTEVKFDFSGITRKEFREMFSVSQSNPDGDATVTKITGLTSETLDGLTQKEWIGLVREIVLRGNRPDPI